MLAELVDHLWQSTVFAGLAWLLTLGLKRNRAGVRYWVWFVASMKFLGPLAVLVALGSQVSWRVAAPAGSAPIVVEQIGGASAPLVAVRETAPAGTNLIPELLLLVWACGFVAILMRWGRRWTRMHADMREARVMDLGLPVLVKSSAALLEPGVFGVFRPVLLLPEGIADRLTAAQLNAVLAHEMCHVRRRDNLATAMHMVVEAVFWFHPLVWWIGARLMEERERACDEEVLRLGNDAEIYAEGILKVCALYLRSPLECVAGVAGANLNKRIAEIMANRIVFGLDAGRKLLLAAAGVLAVAGPIAVGLMNAPPIRAQAPAAHFEFDVASVKPHAPGDDRFVSPEFLPGGRFVSRSPLFLVIAAAYDLLPNRGSRLMGAPDWLRRRDKVFDIEATGVIPPELPVQARSDRMRLMLQALLADRFSLKIHREAKEMPVYALVAAKGGPKLQKADVEEKDCSAGAFLSDPGEPNLACHGFMGGQVRKIRARAVDIADLVSYVENWTDRPLVDRTGIKGLYHVETTPWLPMQPGPTPPPGAKAEDGTELADLPTIFEVFERLGLKMESTKDKVDVYVIDHVEKPTSN